MTPAELRRIRLGEAASPRIHPPTIITNPQEEPSLPPNIQPQPTPITSTPSPDPPPQPVQSSTMNSADMRRIRLGDAADGAEIRTPVQSPTLSTADLRRIRLGDAAIDYQAVVGRISENDSTLTNLQTTINEQEGYASNINTQLSRWLPEVERERLEYEAAEAALKAYDIHIQDNKFTGNESEYAAYQSAFGVFQKEGGEYEAWANKYNHLIRVREDLGLQLDQNIITYNNTARWRNNLQAVIDTAAINAFQLNPTVAGLAKIAATIPGISTSLFNELKTAEETQTNQQRALDIFNANPTVDTYFANFNMFHDVGLSPETISSMARIARQYTTDQDAIAAFQLNPTSIGFANIAATMPNISANLLSELQSAGRQGDRDRLAIDTFNLKPASFDFTSLANISPAVRTGIFNAAAERTLYNMPLDTIPGEAANLGALGILTVPQIESINREVARVTWENTLTAHINQEITRENYFNWKAQTVAISELNLTPTKPADIAKAMGAFFAGYVDKPFIESYTRTAQQNILNLDFVQGKPISITGDTELRAGDWGYRFSNVMNGLIGRTDVFYDANKNSVLEDTELVRTSTNWQNMGQLWAMNPNANPYLRGGTVLEPWGSNAGIPQIRLRGVGDMLTGEAAQQKLASVAEFMRNREFEQDIRRAGYIGSNTAQWVAPEIRLGAFQGISEQSLQLALGFTDAQGNIDRSVAGRLTKARLEDMLFSTAPGISIFPTTGQRPGEVGIVRDGEVIQLPGLNLRGIGGGGFERTEFAMPEIPTALEPLFPASSSSLPTVSSPMSQWSRDFYAGADRVANVIDSWMKIADVGAQRIQAGLPSGLGTIYGGAYQVGRGLTFTAEAGAVRMAGMIPGGVEVLAKNPSIIMPAIAFGVVETGRSIVSGLTTNPLQFAGEMAAMGAMASGIGAGVGRVRANLPSISFGRPKGFMLKAEGVYSVPEPSMWPGRALVPKQTLPSVERPAVFATNVRGGLTDIYMSIPKKNIAELISKFQFELSTAKTPYGSYQIGKIVGEVPKANPLQLPEAGTSIISNLVGKVKTAVGEVPIRFERRLDISPVDLKLQPATERLGLNAINWDFDVGTGAGAGVGGIEYNIFGGFVRGRPMYPENPLVPGMTLGGRKMLTWPRASDLDLFPGSMTRVTITPKGGTTPSNAPPAPVISWPSPTGIGAGLQVGTARTVTIQKPKLQPEVIDLSGLSIKTDTPITTTTENRPVPKPPKVENVLKGMDLTDLSIIPKATPKPKTTIGGLGIMQPLIPFKPINVQTGIQPVPERQPAPKPAPKRRVEVMDRVDTVIPALRNIQVVGLKLDVAIKPLTTTKPITINTPRAKPTAPFPFPKTDIKLIPRTMPDVKTKPDNDMRLGLLPMVGIQPRTGAMPSSSVADAVLTKMFSKPAVSPAFKVSLKPLTKTELKPQLKSQLRYQPAVKPGLKTDFGSRLKPPIFKLGRSLDKYIKPDKRQKQGAKEWVVKNALPTLADLGKGIDIDIFGDKKKSQSKPKYQKKRKGR